MVGLRHRCWPSSQQVLREVFSKGSGFFPGSSPQSGILCTAPASLRLPGVVQPVSGASGAARPIIFVFSPCITLTSSYSLLSGLVPKMGTSSPPGKRSTDNGISTGAHGVKIVPDSRPVYGVMGTHVSSATHSEDPPLQGCAPCSPWGCC